ncbi:MAG: YebG family protein [Xanthomonadales bacterium]|nr:YebG family protein [Xanthomonadales bacterium]
MTVLIKYFSSKDLKTMFDDKSEADAHDKRLEAIEGLSVVLTNSAKANNTILDEDTAYNMAETMLSDHSDELAQIITGKKPRKPRVSSSADENSQENTDENSQEGKDSAAA